MKHKPVRLLVTSLLITAGAIPMVRAADPLAPDTASILVATLYPPKEQGWHAGPVTFHPGIEGGLTYDDNITLSDSNRLADFIGSIEPSLTANIGQRDGGGWLTLTYRPTFLLFSDYTDNNAVEQFVNFATQWKGAKLTLGVSQQYIQTYGAVIEIGQRIQQEEYITNLGADYQFNDIFSLSVSPRLLIQDSAGFLNSQEWGVDMFLNRKFGSKLVASIGGSVGQLTADQSPDQWYEQLLARIQYSVAEKADLIVSAGPQWRQYDGSRSGTIYPVFGAAFTYRPSERTTIGLEGHQRVEASVSLNSQDYITTGCSLELRQQFWTRYYVSLAGGYDYRDYQSNTAGVTATRRDNIYLGRASAGFNFARNWNFNVFYQYQADDSNTANQSFTDNQIGFTIAWGF